MAFQERLKANKNIKDIQELIDENKEGLSNVAYLKICDKMKSIYDGLDTTILDNTYEFTFVKSYVDVTPRIDGTIEYKMKNKIWKQVAFYGGATDDLDKMIKPCNCCVLDNYKFYKNKKGFIELVEAFPQIKNVLPRDDDDIEDDEVNVKININFIYNNCIVVNFRKMELNEMLSFDKEPINDSYDDEEI